MRSTIKTAVIILMLSVLSATLPASAAYSVTRPIASDGGRLNQSYLYGEQWGTSTHKGVDLSYSLGTAVYAIADGEVVDLYEDYNNGDSSDPLGWGNRVVIRHNNRHWDRTTGTLAYVYSIYAHLSKSSVRHAVGDSATAGEWIAEVDDTGLSSGHHLHLQVCIHPEPDRIITTLTSSTTSRNPELWLQAFNYGGTSTGTVVGKVTDANGSPIGDLYIWGLTKPQGSSGTTYSWSRTYAYSWANPDDILVENWGTTDVLPGSYHLYVKNEDGSVTYEDLGWHTVQAGKTAYVGLYPVYQPDVMENYYGWNSYIVVRNNSNSKDAQLNTTSFRDGGTVRIQKTDYLAPHGTVAVDFPGTCYWCRGPAVAVASEGVSTIVKTVESASGRTAIHNGIAPGGDADPAFEQADSTLYAPSVYNQAWGWTSTIEIMNIGAASTNVTVQYKGRSGYSDATRTYTLAPNEMQPLSPSSVWGGALWLGSLVLQSDNGQPLAATLQEEYSGGGVRSYNTTAEGTTRVILPAMYKDWWGATSGLVVQNTGNSATNITLAFRDRLGNFSYSENWTLGAERAQGLWLGSCAGLPAGWTGWVEVTSNGQPLAVYGNTTLDGNRYYTYTGTGRGGTTVTLPWAAKDEGGRTTGYTVVNAGSGSVNVTARYYWAGGTLALTKYFSIPQNQVIGYHQSNDTSLPSPWSGSIVLEASGPIWAVMREDGSTTSSAYTGVTR